MMSKSVLLISFYNPKALGVRYVEKSLISAGYKADIVFFEEFNSRRPEKVTLKELELLKKLITEKNPGLIGLSVMTSLYLETVYAVNNMIKTNFKIPVVWGGVYSTLFPEKALQYADFVIRSEGESTVTELAKSLFDGLPADDIPNLGFKKNGESIINDIRPLCQNLDQYGYPPLGGNNKCCITGNKLSYYDPALSSPSYELSASRGCPFSCSYCCSVSLMRIHKGKGSYVRSRSVADVIEELQYAVSVMPNLRYVHFWDEIFSNNGQWVEEFCKEYTHKIGLPFQIWCHPLLVSRSSIQMLVKAGLHKAVMGIQSGSPRIRKEIFNRSETQDDIVNASNILVECSVPEIVYDFILQHPFESIDDIRQTYELCSRLKHPFELQLHGLQFFPGSDIVGKAIETGIMSTAEADGLTDMPIDMQYRKYWESSINSIHSNFWYSLTYMTQFRAVGMLTRYLAQHHLHIKSVSRLYMMFKPVVKLRNFYRKAVMAILQ